MHFATNLESCVYFFLLQIPRYYGAKNEFPDDPTTLGKDTVQFPSGFHFIVELDLHKMKKLQGGFLNYAQFFIF